MTRVYIPKRLRDLVALQARYRCGYCLTPAELVGLPLEIEHILPISLGGKTEESNLWLACPLCNGYKGNRIAAIDPISGKRVSLFNPRLQVWSEHFAWTATADRILGLTGSGR